MKPLHWMRNRTKRLTVRIGISLIVLVGAHWLPVYEQSWVKDLAVAVAVLSVTQWLATQHGIRASRRDRNEGE